MKKVFGNDECIVVKNGFNTYTKRVEYDALLWDNWACVWSPVSRSGAEVFDRSRKMAERLYKERVAGKR